ncbi:MAG: RNA-binding protein, partial [Methanobacteriota archaeon]
MMEFLSNKERKELQRKAPWIKGKRIAKKESLLYVDGKLLAFLRDGEVIPSLVAVMEKIVALPKVVVDVGAIRYIASGADVMRPGIVELDDFDEGSIVAVVDERHGKELAIGKALKSSEEIKKASAGKVIKTLHYVGDNMWE